MPYADRKKRKEVVKNWKKRNPEKEKGYAKDYHSRNKDRINKQSREYHEDNRENINMKSRSNYRRDRHLWDKFLLDIGKKECSICGYDKCHAAIEFHHVDPTTKERRISEITSSKFTAERVFELLEEIDKCLVVCANCHREIHNNRGE